MINALGSYPLNLEQNIKVSTKVATKQTSSELLGYKVERMATLQMSLINKLAYQVIIKFTQARWSR